MTPKEREHLEKLDNMVLNASPEELKKIQSIDYQTQMEGLSLYQVYVDSNSLINRGMKKAFRES